MSTSATFPCLLDPSRDCDYHFPQQLVLGLHSPFGEEIFTNIQSQPPLAQLAEFFPLWHSNSPCAVACYLGEETNLHLTTTSFQVFGESENQPPPGCGVNQHPCPQTSLTTKSHSAQILMARENSSLSQKHLSRIVYV